MDKGIFYLVCSVVILASVVVTGAVLNQHIAKQCVGQTITKMVLVTPTPTVSATPTAVLKPLLRSTGTVK